MASTQPSAANTNGSYLQQADPQSFQTNSSSAAPVPNYQTQGGAQQSPANPESVPKDEVGWYFVEQYYTTLNKTPERLHLFYNKKSSFVWGTEGELLQLATGRQAIQEKIQSYEFKDCKVRVSNVDSQASADNGIVIQVLGEMSNNSLPNRKFSQTFFLAEQPNGYYVLNDIFRYLKDDEDTEEGEDYDSGEDILDDPAVEAVVSEAVAIAVEELVEAVEAAEDMSTKETTKTEIEIEGEKIKIEETVTIEPALPVPEPQGAPSSVNGNPQSVNGDNPIEPEHKPELEAEPEPEPEPEPQVEEPIVSTPPAPIVEAVPPVATPQAEEKKAAPPPVKEPERAQTPVAVPKPAPVPAPAPAKPKTWAGLLAGAKPQSPAPAAQITTTQTAQAQPLPNQSASASASAPTSNAPTTPSSGSQWQTADNKRSRVTSVAANATASPTVATARNVSESISTQALKEAFSKFGQLKRCEISRQKNFATIEFETPAAFTAAITANPHKIGDATINIEERRRPNTGSGSGSRGPVAGRDSRPSSQNGRGGYQPREGGFRGEGRGGVTGGRGGRGGYYPPRGGSKTGSTPTGPN